MEKICFKRIFVWGIMGRLRALSSFSLRVRGRGAVSVLAILKIGVHFKLLLLKQKSTRKTV
jgi:hypothetical protein